MTIERTNPSSKFDGMARIRAGWARLMMTWVALTPLIFALNARPATAANGAAPTTATLKEALVEDFEGGLAGWDMNDAFKATGQKPVVTLSTMTLVTATPAAGNPSPNIGPHSGKQCLEIAWLPGAGWANVYLHREEMVDQWAAMAIDEIALWVRGDGQDKVIKISLHCWNDQSKPMTFSVPVSLKDATWHELVIPLARFQAADPATPLRTHAIINLQFDGMGELAPAHLWVDDIRVRNARNEGAAFAVLPDADKIAALPPVHGLPRVGTFGYPQYTAGTPEQVKALGLKFSSNGMSTLMQSRMFLLDGMATDYTPNRSSLFNNHIVLQPEDLDQDAQGNTMGEGIKSSVFMPELIADYCQRQADFISTYQGAPWVSSVSLVSPVSMYGEHHYSASSAGQYAVFSRPAKVNFRGWLKRQYADDLARLNKAWGTSYKVWDEIVPPTSLSATAGPNASGPAHQIDTRTAWSDFMHWYNGWSDEVLIEMLQAARPVTSKPIVIWLGGPKVGAGQGISLGNIGPYVKMLAQVKPSIIDDTDAQSIFSVNYSRTACNQYGVGLEIENVGPPYLEVYHQYNLIFNMLTGAPEHIRLAHLGEMYNDHWFGQFWRGLAPVLQRYQSSYQKSDAAFFHSYVTSWFRPDRSNYDTVKVYDSTNTLWVPDRHFPSWGRALGSPDVLDDMMIEDGGLAGRKLLVIPNSSVTVTTRKAVDAIRRWVEGGGTLVGFGKGCLAWTVESDRVLNPTQGLGGMLLPDVAKVIKPAFGDSTFNGREMALGKGRVVLYDNDADCEHSLDFARGPGLAFVTQEAVRAGVRRWATVEGNADQAVNLVYCGPDKVTGRHLFALDLMNKCRPEPGFITDRRLNLTFNPALTGEAELIGFSDSFTACDGGKAEFDAKTKLLTVRFTLPAKLSLTLGKPAQ